MTQMPPPARLQSPVWYTGRHAWYTVSPERTAEYRQGWSAANPLQATTSTENPELIKPTTAPNYSTSIPAKSFAMWRIKK
ncbi:MAG: hypothetical protein K5778_00845 [Bacteroidaceae bacterium]|nr:hypothetical protein [Bacteroidaceae bacterium]